MERAMRQVVRKLEIPDLGQLQSLVIEHLDGIEPGLTLLDSRLLLGHANVDIVALDAEGALVLVTVGFTADEDMLLKAVEAYSWCLEYPDAIRRLYPSVEVSTARPPRLMFIVERLPDAFHRKIKQLGFSEVDCVEFRHLDIDGIPAVYFDTVARLRRGSALAEFQPAPIARRVSESQMRRAPEPMIAERPIDKSVDHSDKVVPLMTGANSARATSVRLQKMLNTNGQSHANGGAPVIEIAARATTSVPRIEVPRLSVATAAPSVDPVPIEAPTLAIELSQVETEPAEQQPLELAADTIAAAMQAELEAAAIEEAAAEAASVEVSAPVTEAAAPEIESPTPEPEPAVAAAEPIAPVTLREAIAAPEPVAIATPAPQTPEPRVSFAEIANELLGALTKASTAAAATSEAAEDDKRDEPHAEVSAPAVVEETSVAAAAPKPAFTAPKPVVPKPAAPVIKPVTPATKPIAPAPKPIVPAARPIAPATKPIVPATKPIASATKPVVATPKPAAAAPKPAAAAAKPAAAQAAPTTTTATETAAAQSLPQEFEGLKFPNDGVLTRQWMEFLNQMASNK
jgi:hypothetical protein